MRVLLTGASGFVGRHAAAALLARGMEVHTLGRTPVPGTIHHPTDLLDPAATTRATTAARATHLLHLAWFVEPGAYWTSPRNLDWVAASLALARAFADSGGTRLLGVGTCAEYQWGAPRLVEDQTPCRPATLYGASKDALHRLLRAAGPALGLSVAWARLFYLYGPGEGPNRLVSGAVATLRAGGTFATSHGRQRRDFLHVADAAAALAALLLHELQGPVNIGSGQAVPVRTILEHVAATLHHQGRIDFGARPLSPAEPDVIEADTTRLHGQLGFTPRFDLGAGLQDTLAAT